MRLKTEKHTHEKSYAKLAYELIKFKCLSARARYSHDTPVRYFLLNSLGVGKGRKLPDAARHFFLRRKGVLGIVHLVVSLPRNKTLTPLLIRYLKNVPQRS